MLLSVKLLNSDSTLYSVLCDRQMKLQFKLLFLIAFLNYSDDLFEVTIHKLDISMYFYFLSLIYSRFLNNVYVYLNLFYTHVP
jgi:hypothetical protein